MLVGADASLFRNVGTRAGDPASPTGDAGDSTYTATLDDTAVTVSPADNAPKTEREETVPFFKREWNMAVEGGQPLVEPDAQRGQRNVSRR